MILRGRFLNKNMWLVLFALFLGLLILSSTAALSQTALTTVKRDLDGDGLKESELIMRDGVVEKSLMDVDFDGTAEMVILYRNGYRDLALVDANHDGFVDTWIYFYFTGVPWKVAEDYNGDGRPDYWLYFKEGKVYKWEQDRNGDGLPDLRTIDGKQRRDDDFDGIFERRVVVRKGLGFASQGLHHSMVELSKWG